MVDLIDPDGDVTLRREQLSKHPSSTTFGGLRDTAKTVVVWEQERPAAEHVIRENQPGYYIDYLLNETRDEEAWQFAMANSDAASNSGRWNDLCERKAKSNLQTLPIYRSLITNTLRATDRRDPHGFDEFLRTTFEENRRRPSCLEIFRSAGFKV